jgi:hypothetical protein
MPSSSTSSGPSSSGSSSSSVSHTENEGESSDCPEETPASQSLRGRVALVTARCPRKYVRAKAARRSQGRKIPADMGKQEFLKAFRLIAGSECNQMQGQ